MSSINDCFSKHKLYNLRTTGVKCKHKARRFKAFSCRINRVKCHTPPHQRRCKAQWLVCCNVKHKIIEVGMMKGIGLKAEFIKLNNWQANDTAVQCSRGISKVQSIISNIYTLFHRDQLSQYSAYRLITTPPPLEQESARSGWKSVRGIRDGAETPAVVN